MEKIKLIRFALGGCAEIAETFRLSSYDTPESWEASKGYRYLKSTVVLDMCDFFSTAKGVEFAIEGPMLDIKDQASKFGSMYDHIGPERYLDFIKKFDTEKLVKYGHIVNRKIVWDEGGTK